MSAMEIIDYRWTIILGGLALLALVYSWKTEVRYIGIALAANWAVTMFVVMRLPIEAIVSCNALVEIFVILAAVPCLLHTRGVPAAVISLSTTSCIVSLGYGTSTNAAGMMAYQETVNTIFGANCLITIMTGILSVVGTRAGDFMRWRSSRRRAVNAHRRVQLAARTPRPFD